MSEFMQVWQQDWTWTVVVTAISFVAVWLPLTKGARLCWRARQATHDGLDARGGGTSLPGVLKEIYVESERDGGDQHPSAFIRDAAKQLALTEYETQYSHPISMYANILPPIGFIGTTAGLVILLVSMHVSSAPLQLSALALALSSTIFALTGYAFLEGVKIHLYSRVVACIEEALRALGRSAAEA